MRNSIGKKRTSEEIRRLVEFYEAGETLNEIGSREGITRERVRQIFKQSGYVPSRKYTVSERRIKARRSALRIDLPSETLRNYYVNEKMSCRAIGQLFNCSTQTVWMSLKSSGVKLRTPSELNAARPLRYPLLSRENLLALYIEEDKTSREIADIAGCKEITVRKKLWHYKIKKTNAGKA